MFSFKLSNQTACQPVEIVRDNNDDASQSTKASAVSSTDGIAVGMIDKKVATRAALKSIMLEDKRYQSQVSTQAPHRKTNKNGHKKKKHSTKDKLSSGSSHSASSYCSVVSALSTDSN